MNRRVAKVPVGSKWTHLQPTDREKHFTCVGIERRDTPLGEETLFLMQAVTTKRKRQIPAVDLEDREHWAAGWKTTGAAAPLVAPTAKKK